MAGTVLPIFATTRDGSEFWPCAGCVTMTKTCRNNLDGDEVSEGSQS